MLAVACCAALCSVCLRSLVQHLRDGRELTEAIGAQWPTSARWVRRGSAVAVPVGEVAVTGTLIVLASGASAAPMLRLAVIGWFAALTSYNGLLLARRYDGDCGCGLGSEPFGWPIVVRSGAMTVLALLAVFARPSSISGGEAALGVGGGTALGVLLVVSTAPWSIARRRMAERRREHGTSGGAVMIGGVR